MSYCTSYSTAYSPATFTKAYSLDGLPQGAYEVRVTGGSIAGVRAQAPAAIVITGAQRNALRRSIESELLDEGYYEIRVRRRTEENDSDYVLDTVTLQDVGEIITEDVAYRHTAYWALKVRLSDQLAQIPTATALVKGLKVNVYDMFGNVLSREWSNNPAWVALEMMTNTRWGGAIKANRIVWVKFVEWAERCTENNLTFDGVFDYETNLWDALMIVMAAGHATPVNVGIRYSVAMECASEPVMMFDMGNIIKDSFKIEWLPKADRANEIEVTFYDKDNKHARKTVRVTDYDALARGEARKTASVTMLGVVTRDRAVEEGYFRLALNKYILQTVTFDAFTQSIGCTIGDLVYVQHDVPQWGYGGLTAETSASDDVVELDREVTIEQDKTYIVLVHESAVKRHEGVIEAIEDHSVFLSGITDLTTVKRAIVGDVDREIVAIVDGDPYVEVAFDDASVFAIGQTMELWDTDVMEERTVANEPGTYETLTVTEPFSFTPSQFSNFMFGSLNKVKKPFRVTGIDGDGEYSRTLTCLEYNASVYDASLTAEAGPNYSAINIEPLHVESLSVIDEIYSAGASILTHIIATWAPAGGTVYQGADVYVSINGGVSRLIERIRGGVTSFEMDVNDGDEVTVTVLSVDMAGRRPPLGTAPSVTHTVIGKDAKPAAVTGFVVAKAIGGLRFNWTANVEVDIAGYEIQEGDVWDADGNTVLVTDYAGTSFLYEKTKGGTYTWMIKAIDTSGNYSDDATSITLTVPAPAQVSGFAAVRYNDTIQLSWRDNTEADIGGYEVREGESWGAGRVKGRTSGNSMIIAADTSAARKFWTKAYDRSKIYSNVAVFATAAMATYQTRNVVYEQDEFAAGFTGYHLNTEINDDGQLRLVADRQFGEYYYEAVLGGEVTARNMIEDTFDAVVPLSVTWAEATFTWNSIEAQQAWKATGSLDSIEVLREIALPAELGDDDVEAFKLDSDDLVGVNGTIPTVSDAAQPHDGRFGYGLLSIDTTDLSWPLTVPETFDLSFWFRAETTVRDLSLLRLEDGAGGWLDVSWRFNENEPYFELSGSDGARLVIDNASLAIGRPVFVALSQSATERKLFAGTVNKTTIVSATDTLAPIGAFSVLKVG